jgi:hypothetical protein
MPNLTFFVCAGIAACSCLAAFMVRKQSRQSLGSFVDESAGLLDNYSAIVDQDEFITDSLSIGNRNNNNNDNNNIPFVH